MTLDGAWAVAWMSAAADAIEERSASLSELDRVIGDGDHGENMNRGFAAVKGSLGDLEEDATVADVLRLAAMKLISSVGGAAGPLYGTAFLRAAEAVSGRLALDAHDVLALLEASTTGVEERGRAVRGDKTMVDAWVAAGDAARVACDRGAAPAEVLAAAAAGAADGALATEELLPHRGRASYLGERAVGHRDPGAESVAVILGAAVGAAVGAAS